MKVIGKYKVVEKIGDGATTTIYKAIQVSLGRVVALRVLKTEFSSNREFVERFRKEAKTIAKLNYPNIVQIYDVGEENGIHYVATEYCEGESLDSLLKWEKLGETGQVTRISRRRDTIIQRKQSIRRVGKKWVAIPIISIFLVILVITILSRGSSLNIKSEPSGVSIYIDGKYCGEAPAAVRNLRRGKHLVVGRKRGFKDFRQELMLGAGGLSLQLNLVREVSLARVLTLPEGALVYIGEELKGRTPLLLKNLPLGEYSVKLMLDDYSTEERVLKVEGGVPVTLRVELMSLHGSISVKSVPEAAEIYVNGIYKGLTPKTLYQLKPGRYELLLRKDGYYDLKKNLFLRKKQRFSLKVELEEKLLSLMVQSEPQGASVFLDGDFKGKTPLNLGGLYSGEHRLRVEKEGCGIVEKTVVLDVNQVRTLVSVKMRKITGFLLMVCSPGGARVYVDGEEKGEVKDSLSVGNLIEGEHQLQVVKSGYKVAEERFKITAGKTTIVDINLRETVKKWKPTVRLHLRTGGEIEGEIISRKGEEMVIRVEGGLITLKVSEVESIENL